MLKKYDIHSMKVKVNGNALQGYRRNTFGMPGSIAKCVRSESSPRTRPA